ncbi:MULTISPECIES: response regulator [Agrobacterium]|uniref:Response regulator n=2 Tax=Agrobacterium TaxID=357 RepID=A0AAF0H3H7_AGRTU|nr:MULTISPECIES: response regulator [Agrobacterium]TZG34893.1 response regulator transcription factor [Agrobacterium sp. B1(2019)]WGM61446.1 response regulator [Agrobacterium tumefaciens]CVI63667.1 putative transcriptional regulator ycf27 [Agrobacterium salinitolerans str. Hayward 0363]
MDKGLILIVEDDPDIMQILDAYLIRDGYRTVRAADGETAITHSSMLRPDLILLDIGLPKLDGIDVLTRIRRDRDTPIIMVTALAEDIDKLTGLRLGADDYIVKPFNPQEMIARVNAVLKRTRQPTGGGILRFDAIEIDTEAYIAAIYSDAGRTVLPLTLSEFRILAHMTRRPTYAFQRADILDACLPESDALARTVDTHIANLRKKLTDHGASGYLVSVRSIGYRLAREQTS